MGAVFWKKSPLLICFSLPASVPVVDEFCIQVCNYLQIKNMGGVVRDSTKTGIAPCLALQNSYRYSDMQAWHSKVTVQSPNLSPFLYAGALSLFIYY